MKNKYLLLILGVGVIILFGVFIINDFQGQDKTERDSVSNVSYGEIGSQYVDYSESSLAKAQEKGRAVIYFWASWCPTCKVLDRELRERGSELPNDVTILKTNYDTEKELKKKYQIVQQHTLVQVDKNGNEVKKWIGGNIDVIKQELK